MFTQRCRRWAWFGLVRFIQLLMEQFSLVCYDGNLMTAIKPARCLSATWTLPDPDLRQDNSWVHMCVFVFLPYTLLS